MTNQESRNPRPDRIPMSARSESGPRRLTKYLPSTDVAVVVEVLTAERQLPCLAAEDDPRTP
ncbi:MULTISPECIES: hypothetical protein [Rhodococcus]|uniref:hypothetical protein n=1 Tax=Rhodococcus TaxID=1827 RepID=UPI0015CBB910|nr:hypothetical protein [Rhodococcus sp. ACS1]